jgi:hypothetical protein
MILMLFRALFAMLAAVCLLGSQVAHADNPPTPSEPPMLDEPGTYLIKVGSGQAVRLGLSALVAWSPDSKVAAVADHDTDSPMPRLRLIDMPENIVHEVLMTEHGDINTLRWSPDGTRVALTLTRLGRDPGPSLLVADRETSTVRQLVRGNIGELTWTAPASRQSRSMTAAALS